MNFGRKNYNVDRLFDPMAYVYVSYRNIGIIIFRFIRTRASVVDKNKIIIIRFYTRHRGQMARVYYPPPFLRSPDRIGDGVTSWTGHGFFTLRLSQFSNRNNYYKLQYIIRRYRDVVYHNNVFFIIATSRKKKILNQNHKYKITRTILFFIN